MIHSRDCIHSHKNKQSLVIIQMDLNQYKRKLCSVDEQMNKVKQKTSIENLSDELFYEIFDYLDGYDIYQSFSNLNTRFEQLINSSFIRFKINISSPSIELYEKFREQIKFINKQQIYSLNFYLSSQMNDFFSFYSIDSSFIHLESIILRLMETNYLPLILLKFISIPYLLFLTIDILNVLEDLTDIYRTIFTYSTLKYFKFSTDDTNSIISLSIASTDQISSIECFVINHPCTFEQLSILTSYTPKLIHLNWMHTINIDPTIQNLLPTNLSNLTHLTMNVYELTFDGLERFFSKMNVKLKSLCLIKFIEDNNYLDDHRWEQFILKYHPQLAKFSFRYYQHIDYDNLLPTLIQRSNTFNSSFWIDRQWIYAIKIEHDDIIYSICPYKKQWYDNSSIDLSQSVRLTVENKLSDASENLLVLNITRLLTLTKIQHLEMRKEKIFRDKLIRIVHLLPELHSLKIHSLPSSSQLNDLYEDDDEILPSLVNNYELTKLCLNECNNIEDISFLIKFFPYMRYLKIKQLNNIYVKQIIEHVIEKTMYAENDLFQLLCLTVPTVDDEMIRMLDQMISAKKIVMDYSIKRTADEIHLKWKH